MHSECNVEHATSLLGLLNWYSLVFIRTTSSSQFSARHLTGTACLHRASCAMFVVVLVLLEVCRADGPANVIGLGLPTLMHFSEGLSNSSLRNGPPKMAEPAKMGTEPANMVGGPLIHLPDGSILQSIWHPNATPAIRKTFSSMMPFQSFLYHTISSGSNLVFLMPTEGARSRMSPTPEEGMQARSTSQPGTLFFRHDQMCVFTYGDSQDHESFMPPILYVAQEDLAQLQALGAKVWEEQLKGKTKAVFTMTFRSRTPSGLAPATGTPLETGNKAVDDAVKAIRSQTSKHWVTPPKEVVQLMSTGDARGVEGTNGYIFPPMMISNGVLMTLSTYAHSGVLDSLASIMEDEGIVQEGDPRILKRLVQEVMKRNLPYLRALSLNMICGCFDNFSQGLDQAETLGEVQALVRAISAYGALTHGWFVYLFPYWLGTGLRRAPSDGWFEVPVLMHFSEGLSKVPLRDGPANMDGQVNMIESRKMAEPAKMGTEPAKMAEPAKMGTEPAKMVAEPLARAISAFGALTHGWFVYLFPFWLGTGLRRAPSDPWFEVDSPTPISCVPLRGREGKGLGMATWYVGDAKERDSVNKNTHLPECLTENPNLPLILRVPSHFRISIKSLAARFREAMQQLPVKGAILLRNTGFTNFAEASEFLGALGIKRYADPSGREEAAPGLYHASLGVPQDMNIAPHQEHIVSKQPPKKLFLFCQSPSVTGGETPLAYAKDVWQGLKKSTQDQLRSRGVRFEMVRGNAAALGNPVNYTRSWQEHFVTHDFQTAVEKASDQFEGKVVVDQHSNIILTSPRLEAVRVIDGVEIYHSQLQNMHSLKWLWGDSDDYIEEEILEDVMAAVWSTASVFHWQAGTAETVSCKHLTHAEMQRPNLNLRSLRYSTPLRPTLFRKLDAPLKNISPVRLVLLRALNRVDELRVVSICRRVL